MAQITRRAFNKQTMLFSFLATAGFPGTAMAFLDKIDKVEFLKKKRFWEPTKLSGKIYAQSGVPLCGMVL